MLSELTVTRAAASRIDGVDFEALGFGNVFSDHMFSLRCEDGRWQRPEILPYGALSMEPGNATLHYAQGAFEGLKAFHGSDGAVRVFRPGMNARRLTESCRRMCIPPPGEEVLLFAIEQLIRLDSAWIPRRRGQALYIRPLIYSTETHLDVRPSRSYRYLVMTGPVRAYFDPDQGAVALKVEEQYTRSAPGGTGSVKTPGNYGASLYPAELARTEGFAQVLWLDGVEHRYVEEVGAMNIFFRVGDTVITPELRGTILPGITRDSVLRLLRDRGWEVQERRIAIDEVIEAIRSGAMREAFGAGTAAIISPVGRLAWRGETFTVNDNQAGPLTRELYDLITGIQLGEIEDGYGWNHVIELESAPQTAP